VLSFLGSKEAAMMKRVPRVVAALAVLGLISAACGSSGKKTAATGSATTAAPAAKTGGTLVFGTSSDPISMDGILVSDGESIRVIKQIFETLVTTKAGGTDIVPLLAKTWQSTPDGLTWTFNLRQGVTFQDATPFNAAAVCFNFNRWYNFKGVLQSSSLSYYWSTVFGGFAHTENTNDVPADSLYKSCDAKDPNTAVITLTKPSSAFLAGLANPAFSMSSPDALAKYHADDVTGTGDSPKFNGTFGSQHPIGTGPLMLDTYTPNDQLAMKRYDGYWGPKSLLDRVIFKPIANGPARRQALESGEIQGYDLVNPADVSALSGAGFQILNRPAFNVGYVGFNQAKPPLDNLKIRQAIAYALNRSALVKAKYPANAEVAKEFMPPSLFGYASDVTQYSYDPAKAKQLIADSGVANPTLEFWYPTNVSRPYMPDPSSNFQAFKADLEAVGFKVVPKSAPWSPDYIHSVDAGDAQMYLLGWTGDFGDPDDFVGVFFRTKQKAWGFDNSTIFSALDAARSETDLAKRTADYQAANKQIMDFLPGVPYVHTQPNLAFAKTVHGFVPSPVGNEDFSKVSVG
jgi:peptide/nickel transport system substrate-binding protein